MFITVGGAVILHILKSKSKCKRLISLQVRLTIARGQNFEVRSSSILLGQTSALTVVGYSERHQENIKRQRTP